jgi:SAM-dependent methyltransferase
MSRLEYFDGLYRRDAEPWDYSGRGAETIRHETVAGLAAELAPATGRVLDLGCSIGQLTARLDGVGGEVHGLDLSPTAARAARERCAELPTAARFLFAAASTLAPPYRPASFDLILVCDGLHSWRLSPQEQSDALASVHQLLAPGGVAILTEHLKQRDFDPFIGRIRDSPLHVRQVRYLHDRLWYTLERALRPVRQRTGARRVLASRRVGRALMAAASLVGRRGAKHLLVVAQRVAEPAAADVSPGPIRT